MTEINPFKKLRKRLLGFSVAVILLAVLVGSWFYFHDIGWSVDREDIQITYSYDEDTIWMDFELINVTYGSVYTLNLRSGTLGQAEAKDWAYAAEQSGIGISRNIQSISPVRVSKMYRRLFPFWRMRMFPAM